MAEKFEKRGRRKAFRRAMEVLEGLWKALGIQGPPPLEAAESLVCKKRARSWSSFLYDRGEAVIELDFFVGLLGFHTPLPTFPTVYLTASTSGNVEVEVEGIFGCKERAFFTTFHISEVAKRVGVAKAFHPLLGALGLGDLGDALETLTKLEDGEARMDGEYLLARKGRTFGDFLLKRGSLLGDFALDKAFFLGQDVALSYPGGMGLVLRGGGLQKGLVRLVELEIRWGEEKARFEAGANWVAIARANGEDPVGELVRKKVGRGPREPGFHPSPKMRALLEALAKQKRPLQALKKEGFLGKVLLNALSRV